MASQVSDEQLVTHLGYVDVLRQRAEQLYVTHPRLQSDKRANTTPNPEPRKSNNEHTARISHLHLLHSFLLCSLVMQHVIVPRARRSQTKLTSTDRQAENIGIDAQKHMASGGAEFPSGALQDSQSLFID